MTRPDALCGAKPYHSINSCRACKTVYEGARSTPEGRLLDSVVAYEDFDEETGMYVVDELGFGLTPDEWDEIVKVCDICERRFAAFTPAGTPRMGSLPRYCSPACNLEGRRMRGREHRRRAAA